MPDEYVQILIPLCSAWLAGGLIGLERSYHGRPAGFRTHTLVCVAAALLMLATVHQQEWVAGISPGSITTDPTRMAQGIMTGIGFIGAGVIFQEGLSLHGLTTAASIFMTAALGILFGVGYYAPAALATAITLVVLALFRLLERRIPTQTVLKHGIRFARHAVLPEGDVRELLRKHGFVVTKMSYALSQDGDAFEYDMLVGTMSPANIGRLAAALCERRDVIEFHLSPMGD